MLKKISIIDFLCGYRKLTKLIKRTGRQNIIPVVLRTNKERYHYFFFRKKSHAGFGSRYLCADN